MESDGERLVWTVHAVDRARQRAISPLVAELAYLEGRRLRGSSDRYLLTVECVRELRKKAAYHARLLAAAEKAAPIVVVVEEASTMITVFRPTSAVDRTWRRSRSTWHGGRAS